MPRTTAKEHVANALLEAGEDVISATKKIRGDVSLF